MTKSSVAQNGWVSETGHYDAARTSADLIGILETVDLPIVVVAPDFTVARFNRPAASALGLQAGDIGQSPRTIRVFEDVIDLEKLCAQVIADETPYRREVRLGDRWFLLRIAPYAAGGDERLGGTVLTLTNVTAFRASVEQAIYEREFTKAILNTVIQPLVVLDAGLRVQTANRAFYAMFQVSREQAHGVPLDALPAHTWKSPRLWPLLKEVILDNKAFQTLEVEHDFPALASRTLLIDARRLTREGDSGLVLLAFQDITERKRAEQALRASEERLRMLFSSMDEGFCTVEVLFDEHEHPVDYRFLEVNAAFEKQTGIKDAQGRLMREIAPRHEQHWFDIYGKIALTGEPARFENFANELHRWYDVYAFRVGDPEKRQVAILFNDITQRRRIEQELRDADRVKDEFLATLAHELRGPLAPVRNMLEIMKRADHRIDLIQQAHVTMDRQLSHMTRLIDDLLDVSRISRGRIELKRERIALASLVYQAIEACRPLAESARHEVIVTLPPEPLYLDADAVRLAQVFGNLLNNACKYTDPGGRIELSAETRMDVAGLTEVVVKVRDSGIGIHTDKLDSIFGMFSQVDRTLERAQGGLGIGLTLARRLVEMHGGSVQAFSEGEGRGSEFVVRLPLLIESQREQPSEPVGREHTVTPTRRILIVDDNRDSAESLAMLLKVTGNETLTAHDGLAAVEAAETFRPDVVLLDIGLPKLNGRDAAQRIRTQPWGKRMVLVALTGWGQDEDRRKSQEAGFDAHMVKPLDLDDLMKLLASLPAKGEHSSIAALADQRAAAG